MEISSSGVTDDGVACLPKLTNLSTLKMDGVAVTTKGMEPIGELTNLQELSLARTVTDDSAAVHIGKLTHLTVTQLPKKGGYTVKIILTTQRGFHLIMHRHYRACRR